MAQYSYPTEYQIEIFTDALQALNPVVALRRILELDTNSKLVRIMPFNVDHVADIRGVLESIHHREKDFDPHEAASSLVLHGAWSDAAFEAVLVILRDAAPITTDELRDMCHRNWSSKKFLVFKTHDLDDDKTKSISRRIEDLLEHLTSTGSEWKKMTRKEGLYYDLVKYNTEKASIDPTWSGSPSAAANPTSRARPPSRLPATSRARNSSKSMITWGSTFATAKTAPDSSPISATSSSLLVRRTEVRSLVPLTLPARSCAGYTAPLAQLAPRHREGKGIIRKRHQGRQA